jgi:hypothetical protein
MGEQVAITAAVRWTDQPSAEALGVPPRHASLLKAPGLQLLAAAQEALAAGPADGAPERRAFYAAMEMVDPDPDDLSGAVADCADVDGVDYRRFHQSAWRQIHPLWLLKMLNNVGFCAVCAELEIRGDNAVLASSDAAVVTALGEAASTVRAGRADVALAAGVSPHLGPLGAVRKRLQSAPMRAEIDGHAEGCAVMALELAQRARERGARPQALVGGWSSASAADEEEGCARAMGGALEAAGAHASSVQRVIAADGSPWERRAIATVVGCPSTSHPGPLPPGGAAVRIARAVAILSGAPPVETIDRLLINARGGAGQYASVLLERAG